MHYSFADLFEKADEFGVTNVTLETGDTAPIPGTSKRHLEEIGRAHV